MKNNKKLLNSRLLLFLGMALVAGLLQFGCHERPNPTYKFSALKPEISIRLDSLEKQMWRFYPSNADSAESILNYMLSYLDSIDQPQQKFYVYMHLIELYQYQKVDYQKAASSINKAVTLFLKEPSIYLSNSYIFTDFGNIYYSLEKFDQAITLYRIAYEVANSTTNAHPKALALSNISQVYQKTERYDSALYYLKLAIRNIADTTEIAMVQHYTQKATLFLLINQPDSAIRYSQSGLRTLSYFGNKFPETKGPLRTHKYNIWNNYMLTSHRNLSLCYLIKSEPDSFEHHYKHATRYARNISSTVGLANLYVQGAIESAYIGNRPNARSYADSFLVASRSMDDLSTLRMLSDSLARVFNRAKFSELSREFKQRAMVYGDSLNIRKKKINLPVDNLILSAMAVEQSIQKIHEKEKAAYKIVRLQWILLSGTLLFSAAIFLFLRIIVRQRNKVQSAYEWLAKSLSESISLEDELYKENSEGSERFRDLTWQLDQCMNREKPFLKSDFSVSDLASLLNTNQTYISNILNKKYGLNFNDYTNQLRVKEFCRMAEVADLQTTSIEQLAEKVGFGNRSTFYRSFKKFTGITPVSYIKACRKTTMAG